MRRILLLFTVGALMMALATTTAFAQQEGESITATGELSSSAGPIAPAPDTPTFPLDTSGPLAADYDLIEGEGVDLDPYVGEQISIEGVIVQEGSQALPPKVRVNSVSSAGGNEGEFIYGTAGSDNLTDTAGADTVYALGSGDTISAGNGADTLYGGYGWDYVVGGYGADTLYGWTGSDWLDGGAGNDYVSGWEGDDLVDGGTGDDEVYGGVGNDAVYGYDGSDDLFGWTGSDFMYSAGDGTYDLVVGGSGYDVCVVGPEDSAYGCEELYRQ